MSRRQAKEDIKLSAASLAINETTRDIECPFCPIGDKESHSFAVTRTEHGLLYQCYRAKCDGKGFISSNTSELYEYKKKEFEPKYFTRPLTRIHARMRRWLMQEYNLTSQDIANNHFRWDKTVGYLHMPITDWLGREIGACIKKLPSTFISDDTNMDYYRTQQKAIHYWFNDCPKLYFPVFSNYYRSDGQFDNLVLVEDIISAVRVSQFTPCIALLGHHLNEAMVTELRKHTRKIILALDADTWEMGEAKPLKYKKEFEFYFDEFKVVKITKDPKSLSNEELQDQILKFI